MRSVRSLILDAQDRIVSAGSIALNVIPHDIQSARNGLAIANSLLEQALAQLGEDPPEPALEHPRAKTVRPPRQKAAAPAVASGDDDDLTGPLDG